MSYLLIAGEIDLSVGSVFGFLTVMMGIFVVTLGLNPWLGMILVVALGALIGYVNGLLRTVLGIPSFTSHTIPRMLPGPVYRGRVRSR